MMPFRKQFHIVIKQKTQRLCVTDFVNLTDERISCQKNFQSLVRITELRVGKFRGLQFKNIPRALQTV